MFSAVENISFGSLCILTACLSISSFPVHLRAGNTGVLLMMFWCCIGLFNKGINALAFNHNLRLYWTLGCDISAVVERIWQLGLCCSSLCVLLKLESIASLRQAHSTHSDRTRRLCFDIAIGLGIPALQIPLFFIVQSYRLDVIEDIGCSAPLYSSVPAIFVFYLWRIVVSGLCAIYAGTFLESLFTQQDLILTNIWSEQCLYLGGSFSGDGSSLPLYPPSIQVYLKKSISACLLLRHAKQLSSQPDSYILSSGRFECLVCSLTQAGRRYMPTLTQSTLSR